MLLPPSRRVQASLVLCSGAASAIVGAAYARYDRGRGAARLRRALVWTAVDPVDVPAAGSRGDVLAWIAAAADARGLAAVRDAVASGPVAAAGGAAAAGRGALGYTGTVHFVAAAASARGGQSAVLLVLTVVANGPFERGAAPSAYFSTQLRRARAAGGGGGGAPAPTLSSSTATSAALALLREARVVVDAAGGLCVTLERPVGFEL
jgi:hypothetical protein